MKPNNCVSLSLKIKIKLVIVRAMFLGQFCPSGKDDLNLTLSKAPTRETRPDHNTGNYVSISVWVLNRSLLTM